MEAEPWRVDKLIANAETMRKGFKSLGFNIIESKTAIVPVIVGDDLLAFQMWRALYDAGVFVNAFISPGVQQGMQMMRTSFMATHEEEHLNRILEVFETVGKQLGLI